MLRTDCRLCGASVRPVLDLGEIPLANLFPPEPNSGTRYPLGLSQCTDCGHVQVGYVVPDAEIYGPGYKYATPDMQLAALTAQAIRLRNRYPQAQVVLEIGANNGLNMSALDEAGFRVVFGVDPSGTYRTILKEPFNSETARKIRERRGTVDLIVANNVFAHIDDLGDVFRGIDMILADEGAVVFEVQYLPAMIAAGEFDMIYHEHRDYHTLGPLARFVKRFGLVVTDYELIPNHGGSIRVYAERGGVEVALPVEKLDWPGFRAKIAEAKARVRHMLDGRIIPAFGATGKACTLINHFGIADRISFCMDSTPAKQGRYIAGTAIKIVPEGYIAGPCLLTAWNYLEGISRRHPEAEFITPFEREHA